MSTFDEQVEAGARAMFLEMRTGILVDYEWEDLNGILQDKWRRGFARALRDIADLPGMVVTGD